MDNINRKYKRELDAYMKDVEDYQQKKERDSEEWNSILSDAFLLFILCLPIFSLTDFSELLVSLVEDAFFYLFG